MSAKSSSAMRPSATERSLADALRDPSGLVCAALLLALIVTVARILAAW